MFTTRSEKSRVRREALNTWRAAAHLVSSRWDRFLHAEPEMRVFAFASYVAALDSEEAAAADLVAVERAAAA
jgi:tRNA(Leu) C34 or U34 (ribose-2'-O)-methylase TrmL